MRDPQEIVGQDPQVGAGGDSHAVAGKPRPKRPEFDAVALQQNAYWTVPETAFLLRVSPRTVWRELSDPDSKFPRARRIRGRTLLVAAEVRDYLEGGADR